MRAVAPAVHYHALNAPFTPFNCARALGALEYTLRTHGMDLNAPMEMWRRGNDAFMLAVTVGEGQPVEDFRFDMLVAGWMPAFFTEDGNDGR